MGKVLFNINSISSVNSSVEKLKTNDEYILKVIKDKNIIEDDEPTFAKFNDINFHNGTIQVEVLSRLTDDAPEHARGFIGIAFHINSDNSQFECIYIRPTNARSDDQIRRNRSTQYFSYPNLKYFHSRELFPGKYESYTDLEMDKWIPLTITVDDDKARLYVNNATEPALIINDLYYGSITGSLALWVDVGTEGYFRNLTIHSDE